MIAWIFLSVLITAEVSRVAGKCFRNDFEGERWTFYSDSNLIRFLLFSLSNLLLT